MSQPIRPYKVSVVESRKLPSGVRRLGSFASPIEAKARADLLAEVWKVTAKVFRIHPDGAIEVLHVAQQPKEGRS